MSSDGTTVHAHALLEHQEFVRRLAQSLLKDEHAAQDVAQETLLTLLTHPPRTLESMRGWLAQVTRNRVRSVAREEMRRARREKTVARAETDESDARMHERLALQHQVVEVVLGLREPYKTVVVLTYYEGLSPTEIAKRRDVPAGTVRAQLSRALQMLREKLDTECEGGRSAWSVGLAGFVARSKSASTGLKLTATAKALVAGLLAVGVAVPFSSWWVRSHDETTSMGEFAGAVSEASSSTVQSSSAGVDAPREESARAIAPIGSSTLRLTGTVLDTPSGSPVPNVEVDASAGPLPGDKQARAKTTSNAQGRYALELEIPADLPWDPKVWAVQIHARGDRFKPVFAQLRPADFKSDPIRAGSFAATHDIRIKLLLALRGRLVRESDRTAIAQGSVELVVLGDPPTAPRSITTVNADDDGRFLLQVETVEPGKLALLGAASGFLARIVPASFDATQTMDVGDIALAEGGCLEGTVLTADGSAPVATHVDASTRARGDTWMYFRAGSWALRNGTLVPKYARAPIGPDGRFRLCGLAPDEYALSVSYVGCRKGTRLDSLDVRAPASGVRFQISTAVYRLHVFDAKTGRALERAQFIFDDEPAVGCWLEQDYVVGTDPGIECPGRIVAEGYRALKCTLPALAASEVRALDFELEPLPPQVSATIIVTSPTGAPVVDIEGSVHADTPEVESQRPLSGFGNRASDGRHVFPKLVPGDYHIDIEPRRQDDPAAEMWLGATIELHVREGMEPIKVRLAEGGLVRAAARKANGEAVDARTSLVRDPESKAEQLDWRNDAMIFAGWIPKQTSVCLTKPLPVGRWTLRFEADGCKRKDVVVDIDAGLTTSIEVALDPEEPR